VRKLFRTWPPRILELFDEKKKKKVGDSRLEMCNT
jgi:hypothetical protein